MIYALGAQSHSFRGMSEIVFGVEVGEETRLNRSPSKLVLGFRASSGAIHGKEVGDPAEVIARLLGRFADDRHVQASANDLGDLSSRNSLIGDAMIPASGGPVLEHEPVEMSSIEPMYRGPAVEPLSDVCGNALFTGDADQSWYKAVIPVSMD